MTFLFSGILWNLIIVLCVLMVIAIINTIKRWKLRCNKCKKLGAMQKVEIEVADVQSASVLVNMRQKDIRGRTTGYQEQYVPGQKTVYRDIYVCKHCGNSYYIQYSIKTPNI